MFWKAFSVGPGGICSMSLYKYSDQTEANFQRKGLLQENYAVCQVHFSEGLNKVAWRDSKQVKLNPVTCLSGSDSSPESISGEFSGWDRRGLFMQSDWMFSLCLFSVAFGQTGNMVGLVSWLSYRVAQWGLSICRMEHHYMRDTSLWSKFVFKPHLCFVIKFWKVSSFDCRSWKDELWNVAFI